jgi:TolB protein
MFKHGIPQRIFIGIIGIALLLLSMAGAATAQDGTDFTGSLAYIAPDGNIYTLTGSTTAEPVAMTADAARGERNYQWPTWSTDGRLAFFAQEAAQQDGEASILLKVFITPTDATEPALAYESDSEALTYAYWAPANCAASADCRDLAILTTRADGLAVVQVRDEAPTFTSNTIGLGGPFYYSYAPDASQMIWVRFSQQIEVYNTASGEITTRLPDRAGAFQAPMWSPVDDRLLFSIFTPEGEHNLVIADGEERLTLTENQRGNLWFSWSPDGQYAAYKQGIGDLFVVDAATGAVVSRTADSRVFAFIWSPDARKLAYLTLPSRNEAPQVRLPNPGGLAAPARQGLPVLTWNILDLTSGASWQYYESFLPSRDMLYYLAYFDQFAQSHQLWSPDSRYLTYTALTEDGDAVIRLLDTDDPTRETISVVEGQIGIWSYR